MYYQYVHVYVLEYRRLFVWWVVSSRLDDRLAARDGAGFAACRAHGIHCAADHHWPCGRSGSVAAIHVTLRNGRRQSTSSPGR
jgi:hypothetical protein